MRFNIFLYLDVALAHLKAAFLPEAVGHRHIITAFNRFMPVKYWADILHEEFGKQGFNKIPRNVEEIQGTGSGSTIDNSRMKNVLGIMPTEFKKTIIDMANAYIEHGIVKAD